MQLLLRTGQDLLGLFFPNLCLCCQTALPNASMHLCLACQQKLPFTSLHEEKDNLFTQRFWGRVQIAYGTACFYFIKAGTAQQLIHQLKYANKRQIGYHWGRIYGKKLSSAAHFQEVDVIVPVPLHWRRERQRGYNQAALIARGLSEVMLKPHYATALFRKKHTTSLTKKSRIERIHSIMEAFGVNQPEKLKGKHVLLVDDVMTSGATLEACALPILELPGTKVSMVTLAIAMQ
jgi:ComF family protein